VFEERRPHTFLWVAAALVAVALGYRMLGDRAPEPPPVTIDEAPARARGDRPARRLYVHVAGAVRRPGLYRVRAGARIAAAIDLAGGPTRRADLAAVNLAARAQDGQQVTLPVRGRAAARPAMGAAAQPGARLSLASATQAQLEELDGIGPALAERILEYRDAHGGFRSVEELAEVDGIGEVRLATLRKAVQP
jgi:competence protein ComEA